MAEVASAFVSIVPSARGFGAKLSKSVGPQVDQAGTDAGKRYGSKMSSHLAGAGRAIFAPLAAAAAAVGVGNFLKESLAEARESQKVGAVTTAIIKSTGGAAKVSAAQIGDLATSISNKTGVDDETIQSGENLLLTFKNVSNEVGAGSNVFDRATTAAVDLSAAGFGSVDSASKQLGKALNDPIKGISALGRSGVTFTDQQKEQIKTLVKSGDTLGAQKIILKEVESQVGGTAAASATFGEKASVAFGNVKEQIGTALIPVVDRLAKLFVNTIAPAISGFIKGMQEGTGVGGRFRDLMGQVGDFITGRVVPAIASLVRFFRQYQGVIVPVLAAVGTMVVVFKTITTITRAFAIAQGLLNTVMLINPIGLVVIAIAGLAAGLVIAYKRSETFRNVVQGAWAGIKVAVSASWDFIKVVFAAVVKFFGTTIPNAARTFARAVGSAWAGVRGAITGAWRVISGVFSAVVRWYVSTVVAALRLYLRVLTTVWRAALAAVRASWNAIRAVFSTVVQWLTVRLVNALRLYGRVLSAVWSAAFRAVSAAWGVIRPIFATILNWLSTRLVNSLRFYGRVLGNVWTNVHRSISGAWKLIRPVFNAIHTAIATTLPNAFRAGTSAIGRLWSKVQGFVAKPIHFIIDTVLNHGLLAGFNTIAEKVLGAKAAKAAHISSIPLHFAEGSEDHRAQIARPNQLRVWAEPETGGEAYIPLAQRKRARSTQILSKVANHFGYGLTQFANGGTLIKAGKHLRQLGYSVAEGPAPFGPVHRVHTANSAHYRGLALDINHGAGTSRAEQAALDRIVPYLKGLGLRVIWRAPGHYNHLHTEATGKGNILGRLASGAGDLLSSLDPRKLIGKGLDKLGGIPGAGSTLAKIVGGVPRKLMGMLVDKAKDIVASVNPFSDTSDPSGGGGGGGANRWAGVARQVLAELGRPAGELGALLRRIQFESGGNPKAINLTDSNARAGHPSRGLMQTIPGTFNAFAGKYRSRGIYDPLANIYAGSRYAISRYGSLAAIDPRNRPKGYDKGGILPPGGLGANYGRAPERVLTPSNTASFDRLVRMLETGGVGGGGVQFNAPVYTQTPEEFARRLAADQRLHEALHPTF